MPVVSNEDLLGAINTQSKHVNDTLDEHRREITDLYTRSEATDKAAAILTTKFEGQAEARRPWYTAAVAGIVAAVISGGTWVLHRLWSGGAP